MQRGQVCSASHPVSRSPRFDSPVTEGFFLISLLASALNVHSRATLIFCLQPTMPTPGFLLAL